MNAGEVVLSLEADIKNLQANITTASKLVGDFGKTADDSSHKGQDMANAVASGMKKAVIEIEAFVLGVKGIKDAFVQGISGAAKYQDAEVALEQALRRTGQATTDKIAKVHTLTNELARTTPYTKDQIAQDMAWGLQMGLNSDRIDEISKAAAGLAYLMHGDLQTGYNAIVRASEGYGSALRRYGIYINENTSAEQQAEEVLKKGLAIYPQMVERMGDAVGVYDQFKKAIEAVKVTFGEAFLPVLTQTAKAVTAWVQGHEKDIQYWAERHGGLSPRGQGRFSRVREVHADGLRRGYGGGLGEFRGGLADGRQARGRSCPAGRRRHREGPDGQHQGSRHGHQWL